jgi:thiol:disulfide interchange protein DsbD
MAWLLFGVGLRFSGVFTAGLGWAGAGEGLAARGGHTGSFFAGLLAVVVATPCTAPFMGAAVAAALAASAPVTLAIFLSMGIGLAAPYLLLALVPSLARLLPRPGAWMETLKQVLAFPIYAASAWLVWVISQQAGPAGVLATVSGLVLVGFAAWALGHAQHAGGRARRSFRAAAMAALLVAVAALPGIAGLQARAVSAREDQQAFSVARLAELRRENRPVFVDMTAAWCVTCLVNERVAIGTDAVKQAFAEDDVTYLKGDWTRQDPAITAFLRQNGRDGVPLYVFFPGGGGQPEVLPQILTESEVLGLLRTS